MELEQLSILEKKVLQAVQLIETLRQKNEELVKENNDLRHELQANSTRVQQLEAEISRLNDVASKTDINEEKEAQIKSKVENMLVKLEELQYNL